MITMRVIICIFALLLPLALTMKEVPGEELPSNDITGLPKDDDSSMLDQDGHPAEGHGQMVKRASGEIGARRRSALDKTFMRFGRSDPSIGEPRVKMGGGNLMRFGRNAKTDYLRLARARNQDFMRFGRSPGNLMRFGRGGNLMRFGRGGNNLMRFGRGGNNLMRFGRGGNNLMRFGRGGHNLMRFGRANNLMRFGRAGNLMRFGRSANELDNYENEPSIDEMEEDNDKIEMSPTLPSGIFLRMERSVKESQVPKVVNYVDRKNDNFMRLGRSLLDKSYDDMDEDSIESSVQDAFNAMESDNDKLAQIQKAKLYLNENYMKLGRYSTDMPSDDQEIDAFDILFPEEPRKKRSLLNKTGVKDEPTSDTKHEPEPNAEVSSIRHVQPDGSTRCSS